MIYYYLLQLDKHLIQEEEDGEQGSDSSPTCQTSVESDSSSVYKTSVDSNSSAEYETANEQFPPIEESGSCDSQKLFSDFEADVRKTL